MRLRENQTQTKEPLIWSQVERRTAVLQALLTEMIPKEVLSTIGEKYHEFPTDSDALSWLAELAGLAGQSERLLKVVEETMLREFPIIRAYHGCRPLDFGMYLQKGILKTDLSRLEAEARSLWLDPAKPDSAQRVEAAIAELGSLYIPSHEKKVYLSVDERCLIEQCGHYLINGSEYLLAVAVRVDSDGSSEASDSLRARGIPTIVHCDLPAERIAAKLSELWREAILEHIKHLSGEEISKRVLDYCITLDHVPPELIAGHNHPQVILDPHRRKSPYRSPATRCAYC